MSNYQDENSDECRTTRLDISKYLAELTEEFNSSDAVAEENEELEVASSVEPEKLENTDDEYSTLAKSGEWQKLLELTEASFSDGSIKTKIWWVAAQFHLELMPVGLLAAPLEAASAEIVDAENGGVKAGIDAATQKITEELLVKIGKKLFEDNDLELGDTLYQRAIKINPSYSNEYKADLKALQNREEKAPTTIDSVKRLSFIQEKVDELATIGGDETSLEEDDALLTEIPSIGKKKTTSPFVYAFFVLLLALSSFGTYKLLPLFEGSTVLADTTSSKTAYEVLDEQIAHNFQLKPPELKPQVVPDSGSLDGILRALKDPNAAHSNSVDISEKEVTVKEGKTVELKLVADVPQQDIGNRDGAVVDTQGPLEPEIVRQIMNNGSIIRDNDIGIDRVNKPIIGVSDKTQPIVPAYVIPPKTAADSEKMYEINGFTEIRGEPNMAAPVLEKLITGDRVRVAETFGRWARIVSKGGRDGYIQKSALGREI